MDIQLITFASEDQKNTIREVHSALLRELEKFFTIQFIDSKHLETQSEDKNFKIVFIASGGVENTVIQQYEHLPHPTIFLADGLDNSLAATMEISSWLRGRGLKSTILHGSIPSIVSRIQTLHKNFKVQLSISEKRIGVFGTPEPWLIASNVDYLLAKRRWGVEYVDIPLETVYAVFKQVKEEEVEPASAAFISQASECKEPNKEDIVKAIRLYKALKKICDDEQLDAMTLSCFHLLKKLGTTGCLALSWLNDAGIPAGCEGDLQSIFTMLVAKELTGQGSFMGNPAMIDVGTNEIVLSHCTVGIKQTKSYILRNHFETGKGVGIEGIFPAGSMTLLRCGGECLDEYYLSTGNMGRNLSNPDYCRTQIRLSMNTPVDYFLKNPIGNHHVMIQGNHESIINEFLLANACKRIE